jgi:hypothetical protein
MLKISLMCKSILLEKALKRFLKHQITNYSDCDVVLSDQPLEIEKPLLVIGTEHYANISKPFTHADLLLELDKFSKSLTKSAKSRPLSPSLEDKISHLTEQFNHDLINLIKEHNENESI